MVAFATIATAYHEFRALHQFLNVCLGASAYENWASAM